jgi:hypothetical protein
MAIQNCVYGTLGWQSQLRVVGMDSVAQFRGAPGGKLFFEVHNQLLNLEGQAVGLPKRPSGAIRKGF